ASHPITALMPIAALPRSSSRRNRFMQYLLTAYIDRLRPRPPPHRAAPFALGTHVPILNAAQLTRLCASNTPEQRLCAPSRSHRRANAHPYTATRRARNQRNAKTSPNSHRPHLLPLSSSESDVMGTMSSLGAVSDSRLTQIQFNPSPNLESGPSRGQRIRVLLFSYP
ncbi:hypothetical protein B0H16DRAFT_1621007, partial [Mycena metata]